MVTLIPSKVDPRVNFGEKVLFEAFQKVVDRPDWVCLHGLHQYKVVQGVEAEGDFVVLIPGKGIVVIESKGATSAELDGSTWTLEGVPEQARHKDPLEQVEHVRNNVRAVINTNDIDASSLPIARIVWFPKLQPLEFTEVGDKGMEYYPWEILFKPDLASLAEKVEYAITREIEVGPEKGRKYKPELFPALEMKKILDILLVRAKASMAAGEIDEVRRVQLSGASDYLEPLWDAISSNPYIYIQGPAGTGKSLLLKHAAESFAAEGRKVLVTCSGQMAADELRLHFEYHPSVDVYYMPDLFLSVAQLKTHKNTTDWYKEELPTKAKSALMYNPHLAGYDAICIDEFQDIAARPKVVDAIFRFFASDSPFDPTAVLAGDDYQQIMDDDHNEGYEVVNELLGEKFVRVLLTRNCRQAPGLSHAIYNFLQWDDRQFKHQLNKEVDWSFDVVRTTSGSETSDLARVLKNLLKTNKPEQIRILSPFGEKESLLAKLFKKEDATKEEHWLKSQLRHSTTDGRVRWRSISKFKGLEQEVIVITDINRAAADWAHGIGQSLDEILYVGLSRAKFQVVLMIGDGLYPKAKASNT
jgi:hypothetical protein